MKDCRRRLWIFDFDGTLSQLVPDRNAACLHTEAQKLLEELVANPADRVAVLSSRTVDDLKDRVPIPLVFLGGSSGLEWQLPGGRRISPHASEEMRLEDLRRRVFPVLKSIETFPGVELEDKRWSVAIHFRQVPTEDRSLLLQNIEALKGFRDIRLHEGPFVVEVQLMQRGDKSFGVRRLCQLLDFDPAEGQILYAGDDENDATAMRWVLNHKGRAFVLGGRVQVAGAHYLDGPSFLAQAVRAMIDMPD